MEREVSRCILLYKQVCFKYLELVMIAQLTLDDVVGFFVGFPGLLLRTTWGSGFWGFFYFILQRTVGSDHSKHTVFHHPLF